MTRPGRRWSLSRSSRDKIACEGGCSYAEEFAANIPESTLRANPMGLAVTFTDRAGDAQDDYPVRRPDRGAARGRRCAAECRVAPRCSGRTAVSDGSPAVIGGLGPLDPVLQIRRARQRSRSRQVDRSGAVRIVSWDDRAREHRLVRRGPMQRGHGLNRGKQRHEDDRDHPGRGDHPPTAQIALCNTPARPLPRYIPA